MTEAKDNTINLIYLGACTLSNGKQGARWITCEAFDQCADDKSVDPVELVRRVASAFGKDTGKSRTIGAVYQTTGDVDENGNVTSARFGQMKFIDRVAHPVIEAFEAIDWHAREVDRNRRAENLVKGDPLILRDMQSTIARIRKLPMRQRVAVVDAIRSALLNEALKSGRD
jgi:hypothetical protein